MRAVHPGVALPAPFRPLLARPRRPILAIGGHYIRSDFTRFHVDSRVFLLSALRPGQAGRIRMLRALGPQHTHELWHGAVPHIHDTLDSCEEDILEHRRCLLQKADRLANQGPVGRRNTVYPLEERIRSGHTNDGQSDGRGVSENSEHLSFEQVLLAFGRSETEGDLPRRAGIAGGPVQREPPLRETVRIQVAARWNVSSVAGRGTFTSTKVCRTKVCPCRKVWN